ncbi:MAG: hypothetical protein WA954_05275 [Parerythrobacter sp.]
MKHRRTTRNVAIAAGLAAVAAIGSAFVAKRAFVDRTQGRDGEADNADFEDQKTILIGKPVNAVMTFCEDPANLASFMSNVRSVERAGDAMATWTFENTPFDTDSIATTFSIDREDDIIRWQGVDDASPGMRGTLSFEAAPGDRGSYVSLTNDYLPARTSTGGMLARLTGLDPKLQARHDLKRLKMLIETGEIATSDSTNQDKE